MSRAARYHLRFGVGCEHLLVLRGASLIVLADKVGGCIITPGGEGELGSLHPIGLCDQPRGPQRCLRRWEIVVERFFAMQNIEAAIRLNFY